jgi:hypothetical protein
MNELKKNNTTKIVVQGKEYKGHRYIDIRTYFLDKKSNEWLPTKKGITIAPRLVKNFVNIVLEVSREKNINEDDIPF